MAKVLGLMPDIHWNPGDRAMPGYGMRAALQSQNLLSGSLDRIFDELVVLGAVERGDDGRLRRRPEFDWQSAANSDDPEDRYRRPGSEPSGVDQPASPFGSAAVRGTRVD
jgi:hypothetical protein